MADGLGGLSNGASWLGLTLLPDTPAGLFRPAAKAAGRRRARFPEEKTLCGHFCCRFRISRELKAGVTLMNDAQWPTLSALRETAACFRYSRRPTATGNPLQAPLYDPDIRTGSSYL
jgi:hypothetical protein